MRSYVAWIGLALLVVAACLVWTAPVRVQVGHQQRWEYCSVGTGSGAERDRSVSTIVYFSVGVDLRTEGVEGKHPMDSFRRAIQKLGADGWEMVSVGGDVPVAYFKRPLP